MKNKLIGLWNELYDLAWNGQAYIDGDNDCDESFIPILEGLDKEFHKVIERLKVE